MDPIPVVPPGSVPNGLSVREQTKESGIYQNRAEIVPYDTPENGALSLVKAAIDKPGGGDETSEGNAQSPSRRTQDRESQGRQILGSKSLVVHLD